MKDLFSTNPPGKILIIKPSALGDVVHSLAFLHTLKQNCPKAEIHWVIAKGLEGMLLNHPLIDKIWIIDKNQWKKIRRLKTSLSEIRTLKRGLAQETFDLVIDLQGLLRSGLTAWATRAPIKIGFAEAKEGSTLFYTHRVEGGKQIHAVDRYLKILQFLGGRVAEIEFPLPPLNPRAELLQSLPAEYIVIAPSAGKKANMWPAERFGALAARLPLPAVIIGSKADAGVTRTAVEHSRGRALDLGGQTDLNGLIHVIKNARLLISNDTGPMHIAAALDVPVVAIFGPANPVRTGPYGPIHTIVREDLECSPCYRKKPCSHWRCLLNITVERVETAVLTSLKQRAAIVKREMSNVKRQM
ncbi:MAG: glycosyltransferase family 9 protein [Desulfobacteraceae bacterium]|nr:MAG: glycosyltransferase family 9 protein [Desulfobacteraceae bacterium]